MNICENCILFGKCDGRCGDTDPLFYAEEIENDEICNEYPSDYYGD